MSTCGLGGWGGPLPGDPSNDIVLSAVAAYGGIDLSWSYPSTNSYAVSYVRVFRGVSNSFASAVKVAEVGGNYYFDKLPTVSTYYYWIQVVSINGTESAVIGPAWATSMLSITEVIEQLTGQIDSSHLAIALRTPIDRIPLIEYDLADEILARLADNTSLQTVLAGVATDIGGVNTLLLSEISTRTTQNSAVITSLDAMAVSVSGNTAAITSESTTRATEDTALSQRIDAIVAISGSGEFLAAIEVERLARVAADEAVTLDLETQISTGRGQVDAELAAAISTEQTTRATAVSAVATSVTNLQATLNTKIGTDIGAAIASERTVRVAAETALGVRIDTTQASITSQSTTLTGLVTTETNARVAQDGILAGQITTAQSTLNGSIASVQTTLETSIGVVDGKATAIGARYTAVVDVNGLIGGFGVYNDGTQVDAGFDVDRFWVGRTTNKVKPFIIDGPIVYISQAVIPILTAEKIDTRGLSIRDSSGAIVLNAGASLNSQVSADLIGAVQTSLGNAPADILNSTLKASVSLWPDVNFAGSVWPSTTDWTPNVVPTDSGMPSRVYRYNGASKTAGAGTEYLTGVNPVGVRVPIEPGTILECSGWLWAAAGATGKLAIYVQFFTATGADATGWAYFGDVNALVSSYTSPTKISGRIRAPATARFAGIYLRRGAPTPAGTASGIVEVGGISVVPGSTRSYRQISAPTIASTRTIDDPVDGDTWYDSDDGDRVYSRISGSWVDVSDDRVAASTTALADMALDSKLTPVEKATLRLQWNAINNARTGMSSAASSLGVTASYTTFNTAFWALSNYLNGGTVWVSGWPLWLSDVELANTTTIVGTTFTANWATLLTAKETFDADLRAAAATRATWGSGITGIPYATIFNNDDSVAFGFNPTFSNWTSTYPEGWVTYSGTAPAKETTIKRVGEYAMRFAGTLTNRGITRIVSELALPVGTFISGTVDIYIVSKTSGGQPGILMDLHYDSSYQRTTVSAPSSTTGVWQRVPFTARVPAGKSIAAIRIYVMASYSGMSGGNFVGDVIFDNLRFALFDSTVDNTTISIGSDGSLSGAGGGQVSITGLGYTGDLNATYGATAAQDAAITAAMTSLTNKLNKNAADTLVGPILLNSTQAMYIGTLNDGVYYGSTGIVGRKASQNTFVLSADGSLVVKGDISGSTIGAGLGLSVNGRSWAAGNGFWTGLDAGVAKLVIGSTTQYLSYDAGTGKLTLKMDTLIANFTPADISYNSLVSGAGVRSESVSVSVTGGTAPYTYTWTVSVDEVFVGGALSITSFVGNTATFKGSWASSSSGVYGRGICFITDAVGRQQTAFINLQFSGLTGP